MKWLVLQLADSAFPTGGFAHSAGLEAALQLGELGELDTFLRATLWQAGHGALPLCAAAHEEPAQIDDLDARAEAFLVNHVARAASVKQGRAFLATCAHSFHEPALAALDARVRERELHGNFAPIFGAALRALAIPLGETRELLLHATLRGLLSAAVRLGRIGPHEAQRRQRDLAPLLDEIATTCAPLRADDVTQTAPIQDLHGALHDRLYSRLFQS